MLGSISTAIGANTLMDSVKDWLGYLVLTFFENIFLFGFTEKSLLIHWHENFPIHLKQPEWLKYFQKHPIKTNRY